MKTKHAVEVGGTYRIKAKCNCGSCNLRFDWITRVKKINERGIYGIIFDSDNTVGGILHWNRFRINHDQILSLKPYQLTEEESTSLTLYCVNRILSGRAQGDSW